MPTITKTTKRVFVGSRTPAAAVTVAPGSRTWPPVIAPPPPAHPQECCCLACVGLKCLDRTRFFSGQLLTEADLNNEQSYWLAKSRLHNRYLHGWGVVCGMQVVCSECDGWVTVRPGYAIDPCGNDIIVCCDQPFNVIKAINECCTPKPASNCAPLRAAPPDTCKDAQQKWCITIEYQEQESRMVAPLKQATPKSGRCSCGGLKGSCGCGCGCGCGGANNGSSHCSSGKCTCSSTQTTTAVPTGACEPTRVNEGFRLCVIPWTEEISGWPVRGTAAYEIEQCLEGKKQLISQAPDFSNLSSWTVQTAFAASCNYLLAVRRYFTNVSVTYCQALDALDAIKIPQPDNNTALGVYTKNLQPSLNTITEIVVSAAIDCICMALIPPCPPDPCDDRLCLACVTVQGGKIIDICLFGCRHQLVTFHTLYYWLSIIKFDQVLALVKGFLETLCCGERGIKGAFFAAKLPQKESLTTAGITSAPMVNQMMTAFLAQSLGASIVNAVTPGAQTVDLRPLVGQDLNAVNAALESYKISNITRVNDDPAWADVSVEASTPFAPAAFSIADNLTMFIRGGKVVGFDVTNPVAVLTNQVQQLQRQVNQLTGEGGGPTRDSGAAPPKKRR